MNKDIQKLKKEIFNAVMDSMEEKGVCMEEKGIYMEEKDVETIIETSVNMTLRHVDTQVSTHKFFKDD